MPKELDHKCKSTLKVCNISLNKSYLLIWHSTYELDRKVIPWDQFVLSVDKLLKRTHAMNIVWCKALIKNCINTTSVCTFSSHPLLFSYLRYACVCRRWFAWMYVYMFNVLPFFAKSNWCFWKIKFLFHDDSQFTGVWKYCGVYKIVRLSITRRQPIHRCIKVLRCI